MPRAVSQFLRQAAPDGRDRAFWAPRRRLACEVVYRCPAAFLVTCVMHRTRAGFVGRSPSTSLSCLTRMRACFPGTPSPVGAHVIHLLPEGMICARGCVCVCGAHTAHVTLLGEPVMCSLAKSNAHLFARMLKIAEVLRLRKQV